MLNPPADTEDSHLVEHRPLALASPKPVVIGLYGLPGSGKSFLLNQLKGELNEGIFKFYEGSEVISSLVPGGLDAFKELDEPNKEHFRRLAVNHIARNCATTGHVGVVAGHFMFWEEGEETGSTVCTQNDVEVYTHIIYLNIDPEIISRHRSGDMDRDRPCVSVDHLRKWQETERSQLRQLCYDNGILFSSVAFQRGLSSQLSTLMREFQNNTMTANLSSALEKLGKILANDSRQLRTMLVLDADKTLVVEDTGKLFWEVASRHRPDIENDAALKTIFSSRLGYSYTAFRQAALLYQETFSDEEFKLFCEEVAESVILRPEFALLLKKVQGHNHVGAVVITCGLRHIWDEILRKAGLSKTVKVIGGGRIADGLVVTPEVKASLVTYLRSTYGLYIWAFGDSPLDLPMLIQAHKAVVIVGKEEERSKSMDAALRDAIDNGFQAHQVLLPGTVSPRLDTKKLPLLDLRDPEFLVAIFSAHVNEDSHRLHLIHANDTPSARLLMTPMRNAAIAGHELREAHQNAGWYLAVEFLAEVLEIQEYPMDHVQGNITSGYRLRHEEDTLVIPLMRGGEAMAFGISRAFPLAQFVHASRPDDVKMDHLSKIRNVILVDSVINSGSTIVEFARHVRALRPQVRVVVVAGVVQKQSISQGGQVLEYAQQLGLELIALRISSNKYTGSGGTDTGNRLFNTTHLSK
ncbi:hypothetical protein Daesc_003142 [Daldinia eschscholtzii]|uniref:Phosphoribosyltransferase domain-containing protein n=1 Tax=Daldinia eschscholtzii TaxID=292717 RepID=A0AAX6MTK0_9PEZI